MAKNVQLDRIEEKIDALHILQAIKPQQVQPLLNVQSVNFMLNYLANGRKIDAIREYRAIFGVGLKEAKDAIEGNGYGL